MPAYSFKDVQAAIVGLNGSLSLGEGNIADEGISYAFAEAKNTMVVGADGGVQHNLHAGNSGTITLRLQKVSPLNARLSKMYLADTASAADHGQNTITIRDPQRGDIMEATEVAFNKHPDIGYAKDGANVEWVFDAGHINPILGNGRPSLV